MYGDIFTLFIDFREIIDVADIAGKAPGSLYGNERIISVYFHAQICSGIRNHDTDCTETDDSELLPADLISGELALQLLYSLREILCGLLLFEPFDSSDDIPGSQKHSGNNKFLYTVCVRARCVKDDDAFFGAYIDRNIIYARACSRNGLQIITDLHFFHIRAAHYDRIRIRRICLYKILCKFLCACFRYIIQAIVSIH